MDSREPVRAWTGRATEDLHRMCKSSQTLSVPPIGMAAARVVCYRSGPLEVGSAVRVPHSSASTGRILIVTLAGEATSLAALLREAGHVIATVPGGAEALAAAATRAPDLVVLNGLRDAEADVALIAALSRRSEDPSMPVLVLAAEDNRRLRLRAFGAGATDCLSIPFDDDELLARVRVHLHQQQARERLESALRRRQELFNLIAHDIKNPLTSVLFAGEMLSLPDAKPDRVARYLQIIDESTREALDYVRDYLERQAPGEHRPSASSQSTSLNATLRWLAARYELQLEAHGLRLRTVLPETDDCVAIDGRMLRHVGENLLSNAIKYARGGGEVELIGQPGRPGHWQLVVQDRGPGVPADFQTRLFKPFQRVDGVDARDGLSNGLGLALARQIVLGAGGRLWYEDRDGGGARFTVELQTVDCDADADQTP